MATKSTPMPAPVVPAKGEATFKIVVRPFTSGLSPDGTVVPGHCRAQGTVEFQANATHGLTADAGTSIVYRDRAALHAAIDTMLDTYVTEHL